MGNFSERLNLAINLLKSKDARFFYMTKFGFNHDYPDDAFIKRQYKYSLGKELNLDDPQTFSEKLQWLKLYDRKPEYTTMVDKYAVKKYAADIIGAEHVLPVIGVWDSADDINIDDLPDQFVLKCTHDSGSIVVCRDKASFDLKKAKKKLAKCLKVNYFYKNREWPYKNVVRRIIAEPFLDSLGKPDSYEYKFTCGYGKVCFSTICKGVAHSSLDVRTNDTYDRDFIFHPGYAYYKNSEHPLTEKPAHFDEMFEMAEKLSVGIPSVRVDFFVHNDQVYFGEMTFYTWAGYIQFTPDELDVRLSEFIKLPDHKTC